MASASPELQGHKSYIAQEEYADNRDINQDMENIKTSEVRIGSEFGTILAPDSSNEDISIDQRQLTIEESFELAKK